VIPPGTPVIDTRGETMMPGMTEAHAHLVIVGHGDYERDVVVKDGVPYRDSIRIELY
jgi:predicted amidohydrolase YtcJ